MKLVPTLFSPNADKCLLMKVTEVEMELMMAHVNSWVIKHSGLNTHLAQIWGWQCKMQVLIRLPRKMLINTETGNESRTRIIISYRQMTINPSCSYRLVCITTKSSIWVYLQKKKNLTGVSSRCARAAGSAQGPGPLETLRDWKKHSQEEC